MKIVKLLVCLATVSTAWAGAAERHSVTLGNPATIAGTELPKGDYKLEIDGDTATIHGNKQTVKAPIKMEEGAQKYASTMVRYKLADGKYSVVEILLGGSKSKVIFSN